LYSLVRGWFTVIQFPVPVTHGSAVAVYTTVWFTHFVHYVTVRYVVYLQPSHTRVGLFALRFIHTQHLRGLRAHTYAPLLLRLFTVAYTDCGFTVYTSPCPHFYVWLPVCWAFAHTAVTVCFTVTWFGYGWLPVVHTFTVYVVRLVGCGCTRLTRLRCRLRLPRLHLVAHALVAHTHTHRFAHAYTRLRVATVGSGHTHVPHMVCGCTFVTRLRLHTVYLFTLRRCSYVAFGCPGCGYFARQQPTLHYGWFTRLPLPLVWFTHVVYVYGFWFTVTYTVTVTGYARACGCCTRCTVTRLHTFAHTQLRTTVWLRFGFGLPRCLHTAFPTFGLRTHTTPRFTPFTVVTHVTFTPHVVVHPHCPTLVTLQLVTTVVATRYGSLHTVTRLLPRYDYVWLGSYTLPAGSITLVCTHVRSRCVRVTGCYVGAGLCSYTYSLHTHGLLRFTRRYTRLRLLVTRLHMHTYVRPRLHTTFVTTRFGCYILHTLRLRTYTGYVCCLVTFRLGWLPRVTRFTHARYTFTVALLRCTLHTHVVTFALVHICHGLRLGYTPFYTLPVYVTAFARLPGLVVLAPHILVGFGYRLLRLLLRCRHTHTRLRTFTVGLVGCWLHCLLVTLVAVLTHVGYTRFGCYGSFVPGWLLRCNDAHNVLGSADILLRFFPTAHTVCPVYVYVATRTHVWTFLAPFGLRLRLLRLRLPHTFTLVGLRVVVRTIRAVTRLRLDARVTPCGYLHSTLPLWLGYLHRLLRLLFFFTTGCCLPHVAPRCCGLVCLRLVCCVYSVAVGWLDYTRTHTPHCNARYSCPLRWRLRYVYYWFTRYLRCLWLRFTFGWVARLYTHSTVGCTRLRAHIYLCDGLPCTHLPHTLGLRLGCLRLRYVCYTHACAFAHTRTHTFTRCFTVYSLRCTHVCCLRSRLLPRLWFAFTVAPVVTTVLHTRLRLVTPHTFGCTRVVTAAFTLLLYTFWVTVATFVTHSLVCLVYGRLVGVGCYPHTVGCCHGSTPLRTRRFTVYGWFTRLRVAGYRLRFLYAYTGLPRCMHGWLRFFTFGPFTLPLLRTRLVTHTVHTHAHTRIYAHALPLQRLHILVYGSLRTRGCFAARLFTRFTRVAHFAFTHGCVQDGLHFVGYGCGLHTHTVAAGC